MDSDFVDPTPDDTLLTTYLDGELTPVERQNVEQRLAQEPELREHLVLLEKTRDCLDLLEKEDVDVEQVETTLKIAAVSLTTAPLPFIKPYRWTKKAILLVTGLLLFTITFQLGKRSFYDETSDPSFRRIVEHLDMYLAITHEENGLELLRQLAQERVFLPSQIVDESALSTYAYAPNLRSGELSPLLSRNLQRYRDLSQEKMEQVKKVHREIEKSPRRTELFLTLQNFYHWQRSLQSYEKNALRQPKPIEQKAADIKELKNRLDRLQPDDAAFTAAEIVGMEESQRLVEILRQLPFEHRENLLNDAPNLLIHRLNELTGDR